MKQNLVTGKGDLEWKFNINDLYDNVIRGPYCDITKWSHGHGLFPGRAFVLFSSHSHWVFLNTNTLPFQNFFPKLEGQFISNHFNYVQTDESPLSNYIYLRV